MCAYIPEPRSPALRADSLPFWATREALYRKRFITKNWDTVEIDKSRICSVGWQAEGPGELKVHNLESEELIM